MVESAGGSIPAPDSTVPGRNPGEGDCWRHIGVSGDRTCPDLSHVCSLSKLSRFRCGSPDFF